MVPTPRFPTGEFTYAELDNSNPMNFDLRLRGVAGESLLADITGRMDAAYQRRRGLKDVDRIRREATISAVLANLVVAALNRLDPTRFVATPFANGADRGACGAEPMRKLRALLIANALVAGQHGYHDVRHLGHVEQGHWTRLRATPALHDLFAVHGINRGSVRSLGERLIRMTRPIAPLPQEPPDVTLSRTTLAACNLALSAASVVLPDGLWSACNASPELEGDDDDLIESRPFSGDLTAMSLYRRFSGDYDRGGRLYGGFWQSIPKEFRPHLLIDGLPTVELDYGYLHPAMLFARKGERLTFDPYQFPGAGPSSRELGKKTLMRLINGNANGPRPSTVVKVSAGHSHLIPSGMTFSDYKNKLVENLSLIASYFGTGIGVYLQRQDSDLIIDILARLNVEGIIALPIHDSLIVQATHTNRLRAVMREAYMYRYVYEPVIK